MTVLIIYTRWLDLIYGRQKDRLSRPRPFCPFTGVLHQLFVSAGIGWPHNAVQSSGQMLTDHVTANWQLWQINAYYDIKLVSLAQNRSTANRLYRLTISDTGKSFAHNVPRPRQPPTVRRQIPLLPSVDYSVKD